MSYSFTVTTYLSQVNILPNAEGQFTITNVANNIIVDTAGTLVQFTRQPATTGTLGAVKIGSGISVSEDGTISVAMDDDSAYITTSTFNSTPVSFFTNDTAYITATDVTTQLGDIRFEGAWIRNVDAGPIYISPQDGYTGVYFPEDAINSTTTISIFNQAGGGIQLETPSANYKFNSDGITFPDTSVQTTAYTGITTADITFTGSTLTSNNNAPIEFATQGGAVKVYSWGYPTDAMAISNTQTGESIILQADGDGAQAKLRWHQTSTGTYNSIYSEVRTVATGVEIHNADWTSESTYDYKWVFNLDGSLTYPNRPTNARTGNAEALVFLKSSTQKSITTQGGTVDSPTVERLVIAGGDGYRDPETAIYTPYSEGGDVYLWAGRGANGGDIKVDAGNAYGTNNEAGGDIKIRGGFSQTGQGGFIEVTAGQGGEGDGGPITLNGGYGAVNGGDINLNAGSGATLGGKVSVSASSYYWNFNPDGSLSAPSDRLALKEGTYITTLSTGTGNKSIDLFTNDWEGDGVEVWLQHNDGVYIYTDNGTYGWAFKKDGSLSFPDTSVQTSAYLGTLTNVSTFINDAEYLTSATVASYIPPAYDQSLNTTDSVTFTNVNIVGTLTVVNTTVTNEIIVNKETITDSLTFGDGSTQTTAAFNYSLPTASTSTLGGVKIGFPDAGIQVNEYGELDLRLLAIDGTGTTARVLWNPSNNVYDWTYDLKIASTSTLGGIKINTVEPVIVADSQGHLDLNWQFQSGTGTQWVGAWDSVQGLYTAKTNLLPATTSTLGGVKGGANILIDTNGTIRQQYSTAYSSGLTFSDSAANTATGVITRTLSVLIATSSTLGGIKVGSGLSINSSTGVLSVSFPSYVTSGSNISIFNNDSGYLTSSTLSSYLPADVDNYVTSGSNISIFNNDSGYITTSSLAGYSTATAVSELTNDAGYITSSSVPAQGSTAVYARNELPGGTIGMIITISDSGTDTNAPAGNWAPAYWDNDAELWVYIGNSNSVTPV